MEKSNCYQHPREGWGSQMTWIVKTKGISEQSDALFIVAVLCLPKMYLVMAVSHSSTADAAR
jgi:hypothetical protein